MSNHQRRLMRLIAFALVFLLTGTAAAESGRLAGDEPVRTVNGRFLLMNHFEQTVTNEDFWGRFVLVTFGYTFCPDICPTTLVNMGGALRELGKDADQIQPLFVTVDPERDTAEVLKDYVTYFHPRIMGLTGAPELIKAAANNFKVEYKKVHPPGRDPDIYSMDHTAGFYLMAPNGRFLAKFAHILPPKELARRIRGYLNPQR